MLRLITTGMIFFKVIILYFGRLRELTGTASEQLDFDSSTVYTAQTIRDHLIEQRPM